VADLGRWVARIVAICRTVLIHSGIPRQSNNRIHGLRLSSCAGVRRRFGAIELRFGLMPFTRR